MFLTVVVGFVVAVVLVVLVLVVAKEQVSGDREKIWDLEMAMDHLDSVAAMQEYS